MSEVTIYGIPGSPYLRAALLGAEEKGVAYRLAAMAPGAQRSAEHLARHPFGRIPVLEHGGLRLYETQAILRYLDAGFPGAVLQPADLERSARMNQIMGIADWYLFPQVTVAISAERLLSFFFWNRPPDEARIAAALPAAEICIRELDRLKGGAPYMAGDALSLADLLVVPQLAFLAQTPEGEALLAKTSLPVWLDRMAARPSFGATEVDRLQQAA